MTETRKWAVPLVIGGTAIAVGGYILYQTLVGPRKYWEDQWKKIYEDYVKEYKEYSEQTGGALTEAQETLLDRKLTALRDAEKNLMSVTGQVWSVLAPILTAAAIAIILKYFPYEKVSRAIKYYQDNKTRIYNADGIICLTRTTINVAFADMGRISLATAAQANTEMWATTMLYPTMQLTINALTAQLPLLTGFQLTMATYLINALQIQMASTIPTILQMASTIIFI